MKKVIYLHKRKKHLDKVFIVIGLIFIANGISLFFYEEHHLHRVIQIILFLLAGSYHVYYGASLMKIPRMEIDEQKIWLKNDVFMNPVEVAWESIEEISYGNYLIEFDLKDGEKEFVRIITRYPDASIEIKNYIADMAVKKNIQVNPG